MNTQNDYFDQDLLGFSVNSIFEQDTREELEELIVKEKMGPPSLPEEPKKKMLKFNPMSMSDMVKSVNVPSSQQTRNKYMKRAMSGNIIESLQDLIKCFAPSTCKENGQFIVAEVPGYTGNLIVNKDKILAGLQVQRKPSTIQEENTRGIPI